MPHPILRSAPRTARGFTLVELLVVLAIIAVLGGLSLAYVSSALSHAKTSACAQNLRTIGAGMLAFAGDNNEQLPESGATIEYNAVDPITGKNGWTQQIEPYLGNQSTAIFRCPDSSQVIASDQTYSYFSGAHAAYSQLHAFGAVNLLRIHDPSEHIMGGDIAFDNGFTVTDADKDDYTQDPAFNGNVGTIRIHGGTVNILFADGHVENLKTFDKTKMTTVYDGTGYDYLY
jgi:prepilin-type N-terminal cleavage/methylation domain-containing protein/prepilin-type processing-associated H-X9-DG protein